MAKTKVYFWLKVDKKFFDNIFIKKLKNIAGGYTYDGYLYPFNA